MKNMMVMYVMMGSFLVTQAMELEQVEFALNDTAQTLQQEHPELFKLMSPKEQDNVIKIMQEKRPNLMHYVMTKEGSISEEELVKQYGENALSYFNSYKVYGAAILDIMHDPEFLEKTKKRVQDYSHLQLATLKQGIESLEAKINKKKKPEKIIKRKDSNHLVERLEEKNKRFFSENPTKNLLQDAFRSQFAPLYRAFPHGDEDLVLERFMDKYPDLTQTLVNKQKKTPRFRATPIIDVEQIGNTLIQNSESLTKAYEEYKVLKALLEASGINVDVIKKAFVQELQLVVNNFAEKIQELDKYVVEQCCTIL